MATTTAVSAPAKSNFRLNIPRKPTTTSYAASVNATRSSSSSHVMTLEQRWDKTFNALPADTKSLVIHMLGQSIAEFKRRNPHIKKWSDLNLVEAKEENLADIKIDASMQRQLDIFWIITLLNRFSCTKIMPIQVYRNKKGEVHAWDGQHTLFLLFIIATEILQEDPDKIKVPVNVYKSHLKAEMRENFLDLNSNVGKKHIEPIDHLIQMVLGVRVDGSKNPQWLLAEKKQSHAESNDLFYTAPKFGDASQHGAIPRLVEIMRYEPEVIENLCKYLGMTCAGQRAACEKELVMMGNFFDKCRVADITVDDAYIAGVYTVAKKWGNDFSPNAVFWQQAETAYKNWHASMNFGTHARFDRNPSLGMPFLLAQLHRDLGRPVPPIQSSSNFIPADKDLF